MSLGDHVHPEQLLMQLNGPEVSIYEESTIIEEDSESCNVESEIVEPFKKNKGRSIGLWIVGLFSVILISIKLIY